MLLFFFYYFRGFPGGSPIFPQKINGAIHNIVLKPVYKQCLNKDLMMINITTQQNAQVSVKKCSSPCY